MMGRSFLSVKLAFAFGVVVALLVVAHERFADGPPAMDSVPTASSPAAVPAVVEAGAVQTETGSAGVGVDTSVCLWRGCPAALAHPLLHVTAPARVVGAQRRTRAHPTI